MTKLLIDASGSANPGQDGWIKHRVYDRDFYNTDNSRGVRELVHKLALAHDVGPMIWNIERWHPLIYAERLIEIIDWAREVRPGLRQGYYGILPERNYWGPVQRHLGVTKNSVAAWQQNNELIARHLDASGKQVLRGLVDAVDFVCPSIYTFYFGKDGDGNHEKYWNPYAAANIEEARKCMKPVYPFICPHLHPSAHPTAPPMSEEFFRSQIHTCLLYADGVVIWDNAAYPIPFNSVPLMNEFAVRNAAGDFD